MVGENLTPAAERSIAGKKGSGQFAQQPGFDLNQFSQEVAREIGVDGSMAAYGLRDDTIRTYEAQTHSRRRGGR